MTAAARVERLEPYLMPHQVNELLDERRGIEETLRAPAHIINQVQDRGAMSRHLRSIEKNLHENSPKPYDKEDLDRAVRREAELRENITTQMPTQAEMRRCPAGAIDKERMFQRRFKPDILEWKNLRRRLHASGQIDDHPDAREVSNLEKFRPVHASHELNMDNTIVQGGAQHFFPPGQIAIRNVMTDEEREAEWASRLEAIAKVATEAAVKAAMTMQALKGEAPGVTKTLGKN